MEFKAYQNSSVFDCRTTMYKILIYAGTKQHFLQVIHQRTKFWKVCENQNHRSLLSFRPCWHCTTRKPLEVEDCHRLRMCVKLHVDQTLRKKNFKFQRRQADLVQKGSLVVSATGKYWETITKSMVRKETHAAPAMGKYKETGTMNSGQKNNHLLLRPKRRHRLTRKFRQAEEQALRNGTDSHADFERNAVFRHVMIGILPCVIITSLKQDANMVAIANTDTLMLRRSPARSRRKVVLKDQSTQRGTDGIERISGAHR